MHNQKTFKIKLGMEMKGFNDLAKIISDQLCRSNIRQFYFIAKDLKHNGITL